MTFYEDHERPWLPTSDDRDWIGCIHGRLGIDGKWSNLGEVLSIKLNVGPGKFSGAR